MIKVIQTKLHSETVNGNCLAAAIASLIDCTIEEQPPYEDIDKWTSAMIRFLKLKGYEFEGTARNHEANDYEGVDGYVIMCGDSPRGNFGHCVLWKNGVVHDPHPSNAGLKSPEYFFLIKKNQMND